jgi:multisubunit Na+/H+ antiporter MnhF subunit
MNEWEIVATVLGTGLVACGALALLGGIGDALVALEIAGTLVTAILMALSEGLQRQPFIDLALTVGVLSLLGSLVFARMLEEEP